MRGYFNRSVHAAPLALFRIGMGAMLLFSIVRFWANGWIESLYINPGYFFPYFGLGFIVPLGQYTYLLFLLCAISALMVVLGFYYRVAIVLLFSSFTYIELIDRSTYLNHYYFVSLICMMMIFLPANTYFSIDAWRRKKAYDQVPAWTVDSIKLMVCIVYFLAGVAKINGDWLLHALPLRIWLPARNDMPVIGFLFNYSWVHFFFSWLGCLYDLLIPFLLWNKRTQPFAFIAVVVFHLLTSLLFQIGVFPYVMIVTAVIFFPESVHKKIIQKTGNLMKLPDYFITPVNSFIYKKCTLLFLKTFFTLFFILQILIPFRYLLYPGNLFWNEEGYRFSWRVMLMEKAGYTQFTVKDSLTGKMIVVNNNDFLTLNQEKMMSTQPDMILQYAHILRDYYARHGFQKPEVYVDAYVALNGRLGKTMIDPRTDLAKEEDSFCHKSWILPY